MTVLYLILLLLSAACFFAYAFDVAANKVNLLSLGLFFWVLVPLIQTVQRV